MENNSLIIALFMMILNNKKNESSNSLINYFSTIEIDSKYTMEKIKIIKKIGPYFPEHYIPKINKSILFTERFIKLNELVDFINKEKDDYIKEPIELTNHKDRLNKIITTIKKETSKPNIGNLGKIMDLIVNMDKYKTIFNLINTTINNQDNTKDPTELLKTIAPIMSNDVKMDNDKIKEVTKMMEIFKVINSPKKEGPKENKVIEIIEKPTKE